MREPPLAIVAVIFPANLQFFVSFLQSVRQQRSTGFDLVLVVDGVDDVERWLAPFRTSFTCRLLACSGSIADIRGQMLSWLEAERYELIVFADTDDILSSDRVMVARAGLDNFPMVVHDLAPFTREGTWATSTYWASRLGEHAIIEQHQLLDSNVAGLGNTSVRKDLLKQLQLRPPSPLLAPDWFIFFQLLHNKQALFTSQGVVHYRQHTGNQTGLQRTDFARLQRQIQTKIQHYEALLAHDSTLASRLGKYQSLKERITRDRAWVEQQITNINQQPIHYFWWEETNYLNG